MTTEYVLQKKTLGGWSYVSWWSENELDRAQRSYDSMTKGDTGYSWRLCKLEVMQEKLLDDTTEVPREEVEEVTPAKKAWDSQHGWGATPAPKVGDTISWGNGEQSKVIVTASPKSSHGLSGSVWVGNLSTKEKKRVPAAEADKLLADGWVRAGPRTVL